jgi:peptide-methionine (R)-S-oxide reductase
MKYILSFVFMFQISLISQNQEGCVSNCHFDGKKLVLTEKEWKERLPTEQFEILRKHGTEPAHNNAYYNNKANGTYVCGGCGLKLFRSKDKYDSGTGWPSFTQPLNIENVYFKEDYTSGRLRVAVECSRCEGHLGHVFEDGPLPTGLRYCMNSGALKFISQ